jgi:hypothetical protein
MTTVIEPYWFGKTEQEIRAAVAARDETWAAVPGWSRYEWSDKAVQVTRDGGTFDSQVRRAADGYVLKPRLLNSGYPAVNVVRDSDGKQVSVLVQVMVLLAHHPAFRGLPEFPGGLETRHNPAAGDKTFIAYPEGIWPGTKAENNGLDKDEPVPQHPCRNAPACPNMVVTPGRRCRGCIKVVGREAGVLLRLGVPSLKVAARFGYSDDRWVLSLAREHGGWEGTNAEARAQHPGVVQRMRLAAYLTRSGDAP